MPDLTVPAVERAVATVRLPELSMDLGSGGVAIETSITGGAVRIRVALGFPAAGQQLAAECGVALLGQVPLNAGIRAQTDAGQPPVIAEPDGAIALRYRAIARRAAAILSLRPKDQKHKFPKIVVEDRK